MEEIIKRLGRKVRAVDTRLLEKEDSFFVVDTDKGYVGVRLTRNEQKILTEKTILELCRKHGIPVPQVILYEKKGDTFFLVEEIKGEPLTSKALHIFDHNRVLASLAQVLLKLHRVERKGFGFLSSDLTGRSASWQQFITENLDKELLFLQDKRVLPRTFLKNLSHYLHFEHGRISPTLLHGNLSTNALFIDEKLRISAFTTFSRSLTGDPNWDLAGFLIYEGFDRAKRLIKSYYLLGGLVEWDSEVFLKTTARRAIATLAWRVRQRRGEIEKVKGVLMDLYERLKGLYP